MLRPRLCAALVAVALAGTAEANPIPDPAPVAPERSTIRVGFHDLDLARPGGVKTLNDRVRRAARRLCTAELRMAIPLERSACIKSALRDSRRQIDVAVAAFANSRVVGGGAIEVAAYR